MSALKLFIVAVLISRRNIEDVISHVLFQFKIVRMHMPVMCALYASAKENKSDLVFSALNNCVQVSRLHSWFGQGRLSKNGDARFE